MIYDILAPVYDYFNGDVDYVSWADFIQRVIERDMAGTNADLVLDLGCGTGSMTLELARRGYDMTGVDYSAEMLDRARERAADAGLDPSTINIGEKELSGLRAALSVATDADLARAGELIGRFKSGKKDG